MSTPPFDYASNSKIKKIYLELPDGYKYRHHSYGEGAEEEKAFLGRAQILRKFVDILKNGGERGVYLVTGYRGMGKTSFVKKATRQVKEESNPSDTKGKGSQKTIEIIELSLAQSQLRDIDVLKHIVSKIKTHLETTDEYRRFKRIELGNMFAWLWPLFIVFFMGLAIIAHKPGVDVPRSIIEQLVGITTLSAALVLFVHRFLSWALTLKFIFVIVGLALYSFTEFLLLSYYDWSLAGSFYNLLERVYTQFASKFIYLTKFDYLPFYLILSVWTLCFLVGTYFTLLLIWKALIIIFKVEDSRVSLVEIYKRCRFLENRCNSQITKEDQSQESFATSISSIFTRNQRVYPIANPREIENELLVILDLLSEKYQYIFVFDELDKVDPREDELIITNANNVTSKSPANNISSIDTRDRRQRVTHILASLKYFVSEAKAKFIFIAGREMFEAALADISDRQSAIGSIFHKVIYVDSFLKDGTNKDQHISPIGGLVEDFVRSALMGNIKYNTKNGAESIPYENNLFAEYYWFLTQPQNFIGYTEVENTDPLCLHLKKCIQNIFKNQPDRKGVGNQSGTAVNQWGDTGDISRNLRATFRALFSCLTGKRRRERQRIRFQAKSPLEARAIIVVIQNFVNYLIYRSNGSPKKMTKLFEDFVVKLDAGQLSPSREVVFKREGSSESNTSANKRVSNSRSYPESDRYFLYFSFSVQYKLGFTSYLFQPFLTMYSSYLKRFSDNTLFSVPFIIDHLIKYHSFAFSSYNLELLPELMGSGSTPITRSFLDQLLVFLGENHLRRTDSGLFEYKFYDRTHNEITFISKWFDDESAAFNFTLDETHSIKAHLQQKIKELRSTHATRYHSENPIVSIVFLNRLLGDALFQDEEYQDAILSYQDALQIIERNRLSHANTFVSYYSLKLKLGLAYEKIKAYDFALGHYASLLSDAREFLSNYKDGLSGVYREMLMLVMQSYLATLYIQDKLGEEITFQKTKENVYDFIGLWSSLVHDYPARDIILSSYFLGIGTVHYFKNMVLPQSVKVEIEKNSKSGNEKDYQSVFDRIIRCFPNYEDYIRRSRSALSPAWDINNTSIGVGKPSNTSLLNMLNEEFIIKSWKDLDVFHKPHHLHKDLRISFSAYLYYKYSLKILLGAEHYDLASLLVLSAKIINKKGSTGNYKYHSQQNVKHLKSIGRALANLGDFLFPLMVKDKNLISEAIEYFITSADANEIDDLFSESKKDLLGRYFDGDGGLVKRDIAYNLTPGNQEDFDIRPHPRLVVNLYFLSSLFNLQAGERSSTIFELRKIIYLLTILLRSTELKGGISGKVKSDEVLYNTIKKLEETLIRKILELTSLVNHSSDRPQIIKLKSYFSIKSLRTNTKDNLSTFLYNSVSNNPDIRETLLSFAQLKVYYFTIQVNSNLKAVFESIPEHSLLTPLNNVSHHFTRLMELDLHTRINHKIFKSYFVSKLDESNVKLSDWNLYYHQVKLFEIGTQKISSIRDQNVKNFLQSLINHFTKQLDVFHEFRDLVCNSIFNLLVVQRIIHTYGNNYSLSYSYIADIHRLTGDWVKYYHLCRILQEELKVDKSEHIESRLRSLVDFPRLMTLDTLAEYQLALDNYYLALQMHREGQIYRDNMKNMIYLEDDYNDSLYHFGAALERAKINAGVIEKNINFLKKERKLASRYKYSTYIGQDSQPPQQAISKQKPPRQRRRRFPLRQRRRRFLLRQRRRRFLLRQRRRRFLLRQRRRRFLL